MRIEVIFLLGFLAVSQGQRVGSYNEEYHLPFEWEISGQSVLGSLVIDANRRWIHTENGANCHDGNDWDPTFCPDSDSCTENCVIDGINEAQWSEEHGITGSGNDVTLTFVVEGDFATYIGSQVYLLADDSNYQIFRLKNREFSVDIDTSNLPCGLNGALYFVAMDEDGGVSAYPSNEAGAEYGIGYCDAQCPHDVTFVAGEANVEEDYGVCCTEMDIWEANSMAQTYTAHICSVDGYTLCSDTDCGDNGDDRYLGFCDKDGCDYATYRVGQYDFYGPDLTVDSNSTITVITQFITEDGTDSGNLTEIRRIYRQNGRTIQNVPVNFPGDVDEYDSISTDYCIDIKRYFGDTNDFEDKGGMTALGDALDKGMVLAMSLFDDQYAHMLWLDSTYPVNSTEPGALRGPCSTDSGDPYDVVDEYPDATVTFSNFKIDTIQTY